MDQSALIDGDGHLLELRDSNFPDYLEQPYRQRVADRARALGATPSVTTLGDGWDRQLGARFWNVTSTSASDWLAALDKGGLEQAVLYPTHGLFIGVNQDVEFAAAYAHAYNAWVRSEIVDSGRGRLLAVGCISPHDPVAALEEFRNIRDLGLAGAMFPADGTHLLGSRCWDPLYNEAARADLPVAVHAAGTHLAGRPFPKFIQVHAYNHPASVIAQFTSMILGGVTSRFPTLKLGFMEIGVTWLPWYLDRLDEEYELRGSEEAPELLVQPSEAVYTGQCYFGVEVEERLLPATLSLFHQPRVMYGSDWPHWDSDYPSSVEVLRNRPDLTPDQRLDLSGRAATEFYSFQGKET